MNLKVHDILNLVIAFIIGWFVMKMFMGSNLLEGSDSCSYPCLSSCRCGNALKGHRCNSCSNPPQH